MFGGSHKIHHLGVHHQEGQEVSPPALAHGPFYHYRLVHWVTMDCYVTFHFVWLLCWFGKCVLLLLFCVVECLLTLIHFFFFFFNSFQIDLYLCTSLIHSLVKHSIQLIVVIDGCGNFFTTYFSVTTEW